MKERKDRRKHGLKLLSQLDKIIENQQKPSIFRNHEESIAYWKEKLYNPND